MVSTQEIFDRVASHLWTQNERSIDPETGGFRYQTRLPDGRILKDPIGALITDYSEDLEFLSEIEMVRHYSDFVHLTEEQRQLILALQAVHHDYRCWEDKDELRSYLMMIASSQGLSVRVLTA